MWRRGDCRCGPDCDMVRRSNMEPRSRHRLAQAAFEKFVTETIHLLLETEFQNMTSGDLLNEFVWYLSHAGQRVNVRMESGRLQAHGTFDPAHPKVTRPVVENPRPGDDKLRIYSLADFGWLEGLT